ncbi:hypothetical protein VD0003_g9958 [Verticillium dahliae]|nr:hypothetical protein VD0003_g9958 [Verticillium dahliae]
MPTFCHGRIRIPKPGFVLYADVMPDKTLDWTAFQVAILGGAGDFFSDRLDPMHGSGDDELEDITTWFDDFGFKSEGRLVRARRSVPPGRLVMTHSRRRSDAVSSNSALTTDSDTDSRGEAGIEDIIPMGYNIGHDLTDFLEWASGYA